MGFACCGPAARTTVARPSAMSFASNPIKRAIGTSFVFALSLKSCGGRVSCVLMTCWLQASLSAHELWSRDIPLHDGWQGHEALRSFADGSSYGCLRACRQINVANSPESTSDRISPRRRPASAIDSIRSSRELRAWRAFARSFGLPSSESMACPQRGAASWNHPGAPVSKVAHNLFEAVDRIRNQHCAFEASLHCEFPGAVEGVFFKLSLARKMPVDSVLF